MITQNYLTQNGLLTLIVAYGYYNTVPSLAKRGIMRIIEEQPYGFEFTCEGCTSKLAAEAEDVAVGSFGCYDDYERRYYVTCPVCGTLKFLDKSTLPPNVERMADSKEQR